MNETTRIAIPQWQGHVSPVFDFAGKLLLIDMDGQLETSRTENLLPNEPMPQRAAKLNELGIDVLICGAISRPLWLMISGSGIEVLPDIRGHIDEVLSAYFAGRLTEPRFSMPGCKARKRGRFRGRGRGRGRCRRQ